MTKILISEFINQNSLDNLKKKFEVLYDEKLCENKIELEKTMLSNKVKYELLDSKYKLNEKMYKETFHPGSRTRRKCDR